MITFTKSTLVFKENFAMEELTSIVNASFLYLGYTRKDPHWPITIFRVFGFFYIQGATLPNLKFARGNKYLTKQ